MAWSPHVSAAVPEVTATVCLTRHEFSECLLQRGDFGGRLFRAVEAEQPLGADHLQHGLRFFVVHGHAAGVHGRIRALLGGLSAVDGEMLSSTWRVDIGYRTFLQEWCQWVGDG